MRVGGAYGVRSVPETALQHMDRPGHGHLAVSITEPQTNGENKSRRKPTLRLSFFAFAPSQRALSKPILLAEVQRVWQPHAQPL